MKYFLVSIFIFFFIFILKSQHIGDFTSVTPAAQTTDFIYPTATHEFQKIIEHNDPLTTTGLMMDNFDFTAYVPIAGSSVNGYLGINHEQDPGGHTILDINFNQSSRLWQISSSQTLNFSNLVKTGRNCSGGITPWGTIMSAEEIVSSNDANSDGYFDLGWLVELDPSTKQVLGKRWKMGNCAHENVALHTNRRTSYFGSDANPGYLFKFVSTSQNDLNDGVLYVYQGLKNGSGYWLMLNNSNQTQCNTTNTQCTTLGATTFNGIEDVEIGPDGKIYFAVKNENVVYRFTDSDAISGTTVPLMETFVGNMNYTINHVSGTTSLAWGTGNDNLAFDGDGNLWVLQDGGNKYIWVVSPAHTQAAPKVKLFGIAPEGSEPTGITFTPDYKFMFLSIQHPNSTNNATTQQDAAGNPITFSKDIAIAISLSKDLGLQNQNNVGVGTTIPSSKLHVKDGDLYLESVYSGIILKSPNGSCWKITVDNFGAVSSVSVPCP